MTAAIPASQFALGEAGHRALAWRRHVLILGLAALFTLAAFAADVTTLVTLWWTSTTFGHCLFIGPVIGWLVWQRRAELADLTPTAWLPGVALIGTGALGWLVGDAAGVALARQLGLILILQGLVVTMLGPQVARGLLFPLAYAFFLVPFGESMEAPLQGVTVAITMKLLALMGVPAQVNGVLITIPNGYFEVAEACSGAKFVIAMIAFGVLVANVCFLSWPRRVGFVIMSVVVAIIANGIRAFATIYAASLTSVAAATGFDHIFYGWIFFGLVMAAVLAIGWHWFDRDPDAAWITPAALGSPPRWRADPLVAAALALGLVIAAPAAAKLINARSDVLPAHIDLPVVPGWQRVAMSDRAAWSPNYPGADHYLIGRYANAAGDMVDVALAVYASQHEGKELVGFGIGPLRENDRWVRVGDLPGIAGGKAIQVTAPGPVNRVIASWYDVGGIVTGSDTLVKLATLKARLLGGRQRAVALHLSAEVVPGHDPVRAIAAFQAAIGPVDRFGDRLLGTTG